MSAAQRQDVNAETSVQDPGREAAAVKPVGSPIELPPCALSPMSPLPETKLNVFGWNNNL